MGEECIKLMTKSRLCCLMDVFISQQKEQSEELMASASLVTKTVASFLAAGQEQVTIKNKQMTCAAVKFDSQYEKSPQIKADNINIQFPNGIETNGTSHTLAIGASICNGSSRKVSAYRKDTSHTPLHWNSEIILK